MVKKTPWPEKETSIKETVISIDRSTAKVLAQNRQASARTKHIDIEYYFVKSAIENGQLVLHDVCSKHNTADL